VTRILTALVGLPLLFAVIKYLPPVIFLGVVSVAIVVGVLELFAIAERNGVRPHRFLGAALSVAAAYAFYDRRISEGAVLAAAAILVPIGSLLRLRGGKGRLDQEFGAVAVTLMGVVSIGLLMGYPVALLGEGDERGRTLLIFLFWTVWLSDSAAWLVGGFAGRHKLFLQVSPGKTVEGAIGALVAGVAAAFTARAWFFRSLGPGDAAALGLLLGTAGMLGDLGESMLKRSGSIKDSGRLFPGHGGMLDRTDSLLFAAPVLFYYHVYFLA